MKSISSFAELRAAQEQGAGTALTLGVFDGLHLGHQALIRKVVELAKARGLWSLVLTFAEHPLSVLAPPYCPKRLVYPDRKEQLIAQMGADYLLTIHFTEPFAHQLPEEFAQNTLAADCAAKAVVCGHDLSFGRSGAGDVNTLRRLGAHLGFEVSLIPVVVEHDIPVKSTMIRDLLYEGEAEKAAALLSRPYELRGEVVKGAGRGRQIGFPTANLDVGTAHVIPARGAYFCLVHIEGESDVRSAMVNVGMNPTFEGDKLTIEAHLLRFHGELAGRRLSLFFLRRLREEHKFPNPQALIEQLRCDQMNCFYLLGTGELKPAIDRVLELVKTAG